MPEKIVVPYFDAAALELVTAPATPAETAALQAFLALTPDARQAASRHVLAYWQDIWSYVGEEGEPDPAVVPASDPGAVWSHVQPRVIAVESDLSADPPVAYVVIEAECAWEIEHGLMLCFREGRTLTKCGGFDGHLTNEWARGPGKNLSDVVYLALDPALTTRIEAV